MAHGQLDAGTVLAALKPRITKGGICKGSGALPADGHCVLGVSMCDFYCDDDDVFTSGLACLTSRAAAFSFYRYGGATGGATGRGAAVPSIGGGKQAGKQGGKQGGKGGTGSATSAAVGAAAASAAEVECGILLFRACKTAAHEILHMYGLGHCVYRACLMNGTGRRTSAPSTSRSCRRPSARGAAWSHATGRCSHSGFCDAQPAGFDQHAHWIRRALAALGSAGPDASEVVTVVALESDARPSGRRTRRHGIRQPEPER